MFESRRCSVVYLSRKLLGLPLFVVLHTVRSLTVCRPRVIVNHVNSLKSGFQVIILKSFFIPHRKHNLYPLQRRSLMLFRRMICFRFLNKIAKSDHYIPHVSPSFCLCVRQQLGFHWTDYREIWYLSIIRKSNALLFFALINLLDVSVGPLFFFFLICRVSGFGLLGLICIQCSFLPCSGPYQSVLYKPFHMCDKLVCKLHFVRAHCAYCPTL